MLLSSSDKNLSKTGRYLRVAVVGVGVLLFLAVAYILEALNNPALLTRRYIEAEYGHFVLWPKYRGFGAFGPESIVSGSIDAAKNMIAQLGPEAVELPQLVLDVKYKEMAKIFADRDLAIREGRIYQTDDSFVRGKIRTNDGEVPVEFRLKGDFLDHVQGRKWSFRVHTRKGSQYMGMRRFSVQHPKVRSYQSEQLYFDLLRKYGVLAPRWMLVDVMVNGENIGIMSVEEHFSKELLESQSRREGIIVRFDETLVWLSPDGNKQGFHGVYDDFRNAAVDTFQSGKVLESPVFSEHYRIATGMLRSFAAGTSKASDVFDAEQLGTYLAISEVFGAWHATRWHNQRFYVNPITLKLEPIGFDASLKLRYGDVEPIVLREPITIAMLSDPLVMQHFRRVLNELAGQAESGELIDYIRSVEEPLHAVLSTEFFYLQRYPLDELRERAVQLASLDNAAFIQPQVREIAGKAFAEQFPQPSHAFRIFDGDGEYLEFWNAIPHDIEVMGVAPAGVGEGAPMLPVEGLPVSLVAREKDAADGIVRIKLPPELRGTDLLLRVRASKRQQTWNQPVLPYYPPVDAPAIPVHNIDKLLADNDFLKLDASSRTISVAPGSWRVPELISMPDGYGLKISAGTQLSFGSNAGLIVRGPVDFQGTEEQPVRLGPMSEGVDSTWLGLAVMSAVEPSLWRHVAVNKTRGMTWGPWILMGGTNFYQSPVTIESTSITNHEGEDGLNIISSNFVTRDLTIENTLSDGFDCDFCTGEVYGGQFLTIGTAGGGDAIDVSLSDISVEGVRFNNVSDKAVSIGEASRARASGLVIENSGTGAAAKDGSYLLLEDSRIDGAKVSVLMAYIKKPEFGAAELEANRLDLGSNRTLAVAQTGSRIVVDGTAIATEDVDVDVMYDTIMRPGLRRPPVPEQNVDQEVEINAGT